MSVVIRGIPIPATMLCLGGAVPSDPPGLPSHAVSLAGAIGRPRLRVTCLNRPRCSSRPCLLCSALRTSVRRRAESENANNGLMRRSKQRHYSITSAARASSGSGTVRPSDLAAFRLIIRSYLVGRRTGRSAGFSPLRIRAT
jgi:hypothetical protein